jgi:hypothetical protein
MKKVAISELSEPVRAFLERVKSGESIMVVDDNDQLVCGLTPYYEASPAERARACDSMREFQQRASRE